MDRRAFISWAKRSVALGIAFALIGGCGAGKKFGPDVDDALFTGPTRIAPLQQQTPVWCWLAVSEMVFRYYSVPPANSQSFQCGLIATLGGPSSPCWSACGNCVVPAGSLQNLVDTLVDYPSLYNYYFAASSFTFAPAVSASPVYRSLTEPELVAEMDLGHPVIAGINPGQAFAYPGVSQHVALVTGYYRQDDSQLLLRVNDPYPFHLSFFQKATNPYALAGASSRGNGTYLVTYRQLVDSLHWNTSVSGISSAGRAVGRAKAKPIEGSLPPLQPHDSLPPAAATPTKRRLN